MKERVAMLLAGLAFSFFVLSTGMVASFTEGWEPAVTTATQVSTPLPVLMYHQVLKDESRVGDYVITPSMLESDINQLLEAGYTPVSTTEILSFMAGETTLPEKPILLTFDDGHATFYEYVYPLLQQYEIPAVVSIVGKYTDLYSTNGDDNISYAYLTWDEIATLSQSEWVEIGNHSYSCHEPSGERVGILPKAGESDADYQTFLTDDVTSLNQQIETVTGTTPQVFAYPFGRHTEQTDQILTDIPFSLLLTCEEKVNYLQSGKSINLLHRYNRSGNDTFDQFLAKFAQQS